MSQLRAVLFVALAVVAVASAGCAGMTAPAAAPPLPIRILSSESASAPRPEPVVGEAASSSDATTLPRVGTTAPRIGAPGGSGAGSRRVVPAQSGNETVGGLPAGTGTGAGVAGRG